MDRPFHSLLLVSPPLTGGTSCILREDGQRQEWHRVTLDNDELDYFNLDPLWPGWAVWAHKDRYISDHTLRTLNYLMWPSGQPL